MAFSDNNADAERLFHLARGIASKAEAIVVGLQQQGLPQPSLGPDASVPDCIPALDTRLQRFWQSLVSDSRFLANTFTGARRLNDEQLQLSVGQPKERATNENSAD